jgi:hypothetical protein
MASIREPIMTVVFVNEVSATERVPTIDPVDLASRGVAPRDLPVLVFSPDSAPAMQADPNSAATAAPAEAIGDQAQHAMLFGRYLVQVQARIDRAWERPRTDIGAQRFSCRARVMQDPQGNVTSVKLDHCNGSQRWRQSLAIAIRSASPLPAPPDPSVYADLLTLNFESDSYKLGGSEDGFEPELRSNLVADRALQSFQNFAQGSATSLKSGNKNEPEVIHLTIIGSPSTNPQPIRPVSDSSSTESPPVPEQ